MEYKVVTVPAEWKPAPRVCRCCLSEGCYKDISTEYYWLGEKEMYSQMLKECFDLTISLSEAAGSSRLICEVCITRLRDASNFKKQVINSEKRFAEHLRSGASLSVVEAQETPVILDIKVEGVKDEAAISDDDPDPVDDDIADPDYDESDDLPLKFEVQKKESMTELSFGDEIPALNTSETTIKKVSSKTKDKSALKKLKMNKRELTIKPVKASTSKKKDKVAKTKVKAAKPGAKKDWEWTVPLSEGNARTLAGRSNAATIIHHSSVVPFTSHHNFFRCFYCSQPFHDFQSLKIHTETHPTDVMGIIKRMRRIALKLEISLLKCKICELILPEIAQLKTHLADAHEKKFVECDDSLMTFKLTAGDDLFSCHFCAHTFQNFHNLNKHMNWHFHDHVCETCGAGFASENRLLSHQTIHSDTGTFPCDVCGKQFATLRKQKTHVERVHERRAALRCPQCDERFVDYDLKRRHLVAVHGVKPLQFVCECKKVFASKRILTGHIRRIHEKNFRHCCQYCSKRFIAQNELLKHEKIHLKKRIKSESETSLECDSCKKIFKRKKLLTQHIRRTHGTNDRRFVCSVCGKAYVQKHNLNKHVKLKHPLDPVMTFLH